MTSQRSTLGAVLRLAALLIACGQLVGCNVDSFFNPSVTGYWEQQPTTIPILERIDVIEQEEDYWGQTTEPVPEDLIPSDLTYRMVPGDVVTLQILDLYVPGQWAVVTRRIDPGGFLRVQELGDVQAGGLTAQEFEDGLVLLLERDVMTNPQVDVVIEQGAGFRYTLYGYIAAQGLFNLQAPDLTLIQALSLAGGAAPGTETIYVIRRVELVEDVKPPFKRETGDAVAPTPEDTQPVDIEDLIEQLDEPGGGGVSPGVLRQQDEPVIDIEDLEPAQVAEPPQVDIDELRRQQAGAAPSGSWIYVEERGEWVRVAAEQFEAAEAGPGGEPPLYVERIIEIPYENLERGESKYNIIIRPNDRIFVEPPESGLVYIEGQVVRPGPFTLPLNGKLTLSRLIAAAGGLGQLAIPERVDLIRMVGDNREAAITVNLGAIRHRTEPDILLKPDDHIIIGTNWWATPIAVIRNGFRATYGFGFLLDRNFGNDVFGAPPTNYQR